MEPAMIRSLHNEICSIVDGSIAAKQIWWIDCSKRNHRFVINSDAPRSSFAGRSVRVDMN